MIAPGTVLQNRYRVERQIGEGGMGAVYVATDQRFGSTVALKETFFEDPSLRKAFEREARLLNHLRHPALPRVSDHFTEGQGQFLVMEYFPGEDLSDMLKARGAPFPTTRVLAWADRLLDALEYLHGQQPPVIHRDIKPQNIKLLPRDQVVLLDFGLAKGAPLQTRVTAAGSVFGYSFNYAPIEQMQGAGTDPRSDLYSLGATLYHLLTATTPPDALTRATAVLGGEPDPLKPAGDINARVPAAVSEVLARAMRQSAAQRFASAEEMRESLREAGRAVAPGEVTTTPVPAARRTNLVGEQAGPSEGETQLMYPPVTNRIPLAETEKLLEETAVKNRPDAATLADTEVMRAKARKGEREGAAEAGRTEAVEGGRAEAFKAGTAAAAGAGGAGAAKGEAPNAPRVGRTPARARPFEKSVATRVGAVRDAGAARKGSRRAVVAALSVVAFALVAAGVYSLARRTPPTGADAHAPVAEQPTPLTQPVEPLTQPVAAPSAPAEGLKAAETPPANEPAHPTAQPHHAPDEAERSAAPREENQNRAAEERVPPAFPPPAPPERAGQAEEEVPFRDRDWSRNPPTEEEVRAWLQRHPGWLQRHPDLARMLKRRMMEQRRMRDNQPPFRQPPP